MLRSALRGLAAAVGGPLRRWVWARLLSHLRYRLLVGFLFLVPILLTFLVLRFAFGFLDGVLGDEVNQLFGRDVRGLGIVALVALVYLSGLAVPNFIGRGVVRGAEIVVQQIPIVRQIYRGSRYLVMSLSGQATTGFNRVVMIEYPRPRLWALGFLMGVTTNEEENSMAVVYIPTAPTPTSGWVALVPIEDVYDTNVPVNALMQIVFSGGIMVPNRVEKRPLEQVLPEELADKPAER